MQHENNHPVDVREVQEYLRGLAVYFPRIPPLAVDGIFGAETVEAVEAFQALFDIPITGEVDGETWVRLRDEFRRVQYPATRPQGIFPFVAGEPFLQVGDSGPTVALLQAVLDRLAKEYGNLHPVTTTAHFDEATTRALRQLQQVFGFEPHGRLDRRTWDRLAATYNAYAAR